MQNPPIPGTRRRTSASALREIPCRWLSPGRRERQTMSPGEHKVFLQNPGYRNLWSNRAGDDDSLVFPGPNETVPAEDVATDEQLLEIWLNKAMLHLQISKPCGRRSPSRLSPSESLWRSHLALREVPARHLNPLFLDDHFRIYRIPRVSHRQIKIYQPHYCYLCSTRRSSRATRR